MKLRVAETDIRIADQRITEDVEDKIERYLDGETVDFDVEIDLSDYSPFQKSVLQAIRQIPYGETRTYAEIAEDIGSKGGKRAVAQACSSNPLPIVIPCHRVVASDGIGGYQHGEEVKRALLQLEGAL